MSDGAPGRSIKVGNLRPSQVVSQHGPGAVVDMPELSVMVAGTDQWRPSGADRVSEPRLEAYLRVRAFYSPPAAGPGRFGGVPSVVFPEWLVCPRCRKLGRFTDFHFRTPPGEFLCTRSDKRHGGVEPTAFPARFMVACPLGHVDDFPWSRWVHPEGSTCNGPLELTDTGTSGGVSDLVVRCAKCGRSTPMSAAFNAGSVGPCSGHRPWIVGAPNQGCTHQARTLLRGASNAYFPVVASALSIPPWSDPIQRDLAPYREQLSQADSLARLRDGLRLGFYAVGDLLKRHTVEQLWSALTADAPAEEDLRRREYDAFLHPGAIVSGEVPDFEVSDVEMAPQIKPWFASVAAATRLREVRALRGFTRLDSVVELGERTDVSDLEVRVARLGTRSVDWLPAIDLRGEGIFIRFEEDTLARWEGRDTVVRRSVELTDRFAAWREGRGMDSRSFPGMRYVLLHSLAHVLIRQLCLDSGYSSSALRERIYSSPAPESMCGVLIYTATTDSDGSLGGLVDQARADRLAGVIADGLRESEFCAADPLCGGGSAAAVTHLNGAACHACLLLAETSCEAGNRLLDRATLVETVDDRDMAYFTPAPR